MDGARLSPTDVTTVGSVPVTTRALRSTPCPFPPLVEPADELTIDEVRRYSRHLIIPDVGMTGQKRLKNAKVLVIGAGGLGSPALLYLAAAGVGTLGIVEFDEVDESNLQRQIIHGQSDIGKSKARVGQGVDRRDQPATSTWSCTTSASTTTTCCEIFERLRPDRRRHRQLRHPLHGQRRGVLPEASRTSGARSTASTARRRCSGRRWPTTPRATAASTPSRRRRAWSRRCAEGGVLGVLCAVDRLDPGQRGDQAAHRHRRAAASAS